ncbi:MAG: response regulator transcription factor [Armatimonadota bacterium]
MANEPKKILLADSNEEDARALASLLAREGYLVEVASSGNQALELFDEFQPDLVVLEAYLPGGIDGLEVCRQIRSQSEVPIMFVTTKNDEVDVVVGLELGADEYISKPYRVRELLARIRALLRRAVITEKASAQKKHLSYPALEIDLPTRTVTVEGEEIRLTPKEFDLLFKLASNPRRVFTREELIEQVWGYTTPRGDLRTVDTHIKRLRKKVEEGRDVPWSLATVWGVGYRFDVGQ